MSKVKSPAVARRSTTQWILAPMVVVVIALGWKYPLLGFTVPLVMLMGMVGGFIKGRYVCGNLCPRGSFFDRIISLVSLKRPIPDALRNPVFRWTLLVLLMGFMVYRISLNPGDVMHWGKVFWLMCVITTVVGVVLGVFIHPRSWCAFCPIGTLQNSFGGHKQQLQIDGAQCKSCKVCEKACPFGLKIVDFKDKGIVEDRDCLKCPECVAACPIGALSFPEKTDAKKAA